MTSPPIWTPSLQEAVDAWLEILDDFSSVETRSSDRWPSDHDEGV